MTYVPSGKFDVDKVILPSVPSQTVGLLIVIIAIIEGKGSDNSMSILSTDVQLL